MGIATYPAAAGGGIKSVQRGLASGSGNVTITAVDITKSFVNVYGTSSSGTIAASGSINSQSGSASAASFTIAADYNIGPSRLGPGNANRTYNINSQNINLNSTNLTGGSNNLVAAVVQGYLSNSTTLVVSGACRWEVVEFN